MALEQHTGVAAELCELAAQYIDMLKQLGDFCGSVQSRARPIFHLRRDEKAAFEFRTDHDHAEASRTTNRVAFAVAETAA